MSEKFDWITTDWPRPGQAHDVHDIKLALERIEKSLALIRELLERKP